MKKVRTHYDNLKVARDAPPEIIRAAYKALSQKHHPDRNGSTSESQDIMKIINASYTALANPESRRRHDLWIRQQESPDEHTRTTEKKSRKVEFPPPTSGEVSFSDLDNIARSKIKTRVSGADKNQHAVKLDGVFWSYVWIGGLLTWFYYIYTSAFNYRWTTDTAYWHSGITCVVWFLLAKNASWVYSWHSTPLKSWLILTPLYLMKLHLDRISYWPIWTISDIKGTHNFRNGSYQDTDLAMTLDGEKHNFSINGKQQYQILLNRLQEYDSKLRAALKSDDSSYIINNDEFTEFRNQGVKSDRAIPSSTIVIYVVLFFVSFGWLSVAYDINKDRLVKPAYSKSATPYNKSPEIQKPIYARPATAPNGSPWPTQAAYIINYPKLNATGLSTVTVDNTQNDSDVFVKLVSIKANESNPVRIFFIPSHGKFKLNGITAGLYDIRYRDLASGGLARSESFTLEETETYNGTRYSNMTMTLYKVRNGNMKTYGLSEGEF